MDKIILLALQKLVNHIAVVLDRSGSMAGKTSQLESVFDNEISYLRNRSRELDQETRVSVYIFDDKIDCLVFDMDVMRMPSLKGQITARNSTALLAACKQAIDDMKLLPQKYGDHAFLVYSLTDGQENASAKYGVDSSVFSKILSSLPENWTNICLVPDQRAVFDAKKAGFPADNIQVWDVNSAKGIQEVGSKTRSTMEQYFTMRSQGIRGSKSFYADLSKVDLGTVKSDLKPLDPLNYLITTRTTKDPETIKEFVETVSGKTYVPGCAYYELVKTERRVQGDKKICIRNNKDHKVYSGDAARQLLRLPNTLISIKPGNHGDWQIFIQSKSYTRLLETGEQVLILNKYITGGGVSG